MRIKVREKCGCSITPWAIPTEDTICTGPNLECAHTIQAQIGQYSTVLEYNLYKCCVWLGLHSGKVLNTLTNKTVKCLSACTVTYYNSITSSTSNFPDPRTFFNTVHSCTIAGKLVSTCKDFRRAPLEESYPGENICANHPTPTP